MNKDIKRKLRFPPGSLVLIGDSRAVNEVAEEQ